MFNRTQRLEAAFPQFIDQPKQSVSLHAQGTGCSFSGMNEQQVPVSHLPLMEAAKDTAVCPKSKPRWTQRFSRRGFWDVYAKRWTEPQALSQPTHESDLLLSGITWPLFTDSPPPVMEVPVKTGVPAAPRCIPVFPGTLSETSNSAVCLFLPLSSPHSLSRFPFCTLRGNVSRLPRVFLAW